MGFAVETVMRRLFLNIWFIIILCLYPGRVSSVCDKSASIVDEGNLGQSDIFPWLGLLRVHLQDGDKSEIAVTGLVLIRKSHALVNADDVARIPERVFREDTLAMFIVATEVPWYFPVLTYTIHPDYEEKTLNTIALVELDLENIEQYALPKPICWTRMKSMVTKEFYVAGYTDDNQFLEKVLYKMNYKDKLACEQFYKQAELDDKTRTPVHYLCGVSVLSRAQCVWENGMVLVSNDSNYFSLLGLSVRGPGCSAPARFIYLHRYHQWVEMTIAKSFTPPEVQDGLDEIPLHELFHINASRRQVVPTPEGRQFELYPFDTSKPRYFNIEKVDNNTLAVFSFNGTLEAYEKACSVKKVLLYKEDFELKSQYGAFGTAYYKISLFDVMKNVCGCVIVNIASKWQTEATMSYKEFFEVGEGLAVTSSEETPDNLFKSFFIEERTLRPMIHTRWRPHQVLTPEFLELLRRKRRLLNYDLFVCFGFFGRAKMHIEMYGESLQVTSTPRTGRRQFVGLTPMEERLENLKRQRGKKMKLPTRKMWYEEDFKNRRIRSGFVEDVPPIVRESFGYTDDKKSYVISDVFDTEKDWSTSYKEAIKPNEAKARYDSFSGNMFKPAPTAPTIYIPPKFTQGAPRHTYNKPELIVAVLSLEFVVQNIIFVV